METVMLALVAALAAFLTQGVDSTTFTFQNNCPYTVWPAILQNSGKPPLSTSGFELTNGASQTVDAPAGWAGRMWARHLCATDASGKFSCPSGDCGSGQVGCNGAGGAPPATFVEFALQGADGKDFYDTSLVDGSNVPVMVVPQGVTGCSNTGCPVNLNGQCLPELIATAPNGEVVGCKSACGAFDTDEYCCRGSFGSPDTCKPTKYSQFFKTACPLAYSYAYDDATSTFTCVGANYLITYCP